MACWPTGGLAVTDTVLTTFELIEFRRIRSAGNLLALACITIDLGGVEVLLHGVQVLRTPAGKIQCRAPHYRSVTGEWLPAVVLPEALERAIGAEILAAYTDPSA